MNQKNPKSEGFGQGQTNADSGFGGSAFGGGGGSQFGGGGGGSEFGGSAFGGTNAVSQIFKDGGFDDGKRKRIIIVSAAIAAVMVCGGAAWWLFSGEDSASQDVKVEPPVVAQPQVAEEAPAVAEDELAEDEEWVEEETETTVMGDTTVSYDARQGGIVVNATDGATIEVSRSADFSDTYVRGVARGGRFQIPLPPPGQIYWREQGSADAYLITVTPPPSLGLSFSPPQSMTADTEMSWSASGPASYYKIEFATDDTFSNIVSVMATSQTAAAPTDVTAGKYFVRVGGLNLASGKWEYTRASNVSVE